MRHTAKVHVAPCLLRLESRRGIRVVSGVGGRVVPGPPDYGFRFLPTGYDVLDGRPIPNPVNVLSMSIGYREIVIGVRIIEALEDPEMVTDRGTYPPTRRIPGVLGSSYPVPNVREAI